MRWTRAACHGRAGTTYHALRADWSLHPSVLLGTGLLGALYFYGIGPSRRRTRSGPPAPAWQIASFCSALVVLLVSLNGPIHDLSDYYLFSDPHGAAPAAHAAASAAAAGRDSGVAAAARSCGGRACGRWPGC